MNESKEKQVVKKSVWDENMEAIRQTFGMDLSPTEFTMFVEMGKSLKLNPFNREIWCVKYGNQTPSIFVGRDGYRKNAQAQPDYNGHIKEAVYENDEFEIIEGKIKHKISFKNRGKIFGAYCEVYRKGIDHPFREMVRFDEYYSGRLNPDGTVKQRYDNYKKQYVDMKPTNWDTMPETMIKKVAEAQALRMAYQSVFAGTYDESERWDDNPENLPQKGRSRQKATQPPVNTQNAEDAEITRQDEAVLPNQAFIDSVKDLGVTEKQIKDTLKEHGKATLEDVKDRQTQTSIYLRLKYPPQNKPAEAQSQNTPPTVQPEPETRPVEQATAETTPDLKPAIDKKTVEFLNAVGRIKSRLHDLTGTDEAYYGVLGANGYQHANEISDQKTMKTVYAELDQKVRDLVPQDDLFSPNGGSNE